MNNNSKFRYPSWREWWLSIFPNAQSYPSTCMIKRPIYCDEVTCDECASMPIPDDIAEKLGITPIEYTEEDDVDD